MSKMFSLLYSLLAIQIFVDSLIFHEVGHWIFFKLVKKKYVDIRIVRASWGFDVIVGYPMDYAGLSKVDLLNSYMFGVVLGMIPLLIVIAVNGVFALLFPLYLVCCIPDLKNIWRTVKSG